MNNSLDITSRSSGAIAFNAMHELEGPICDLSILASINADLLESHLVDLRGRGIREEGQDWEIRLSEEQMDQICYIYVEVACRARNLKEAFYKAFEQKGGAA